MLLLEVRVPKWLLSSCSHSLGPGSSIGLLPALGHSAAHTDKLQAPAELLCCEPKVAPLCLITAGGAPWFCERNKTPDLFQGGGVF